MRARGRQSPRPEPAPSGPVRVARARRSRRAGRQDRRHRRGRLSAAHAAAWLGVSEGEAPDASADVFGAQSQQAERVSRSEEARGARRVLEARDALRRRARTVSAGRARPPRPLARDAPREKPAPRRLRAHRLRTRRAARASCGARHRLPRARGRARFSGARGRAAAAAGFPARGRERRALVA